MRHYVIVKILDQYLDLAIQQFQRSPIPWI